MAKNQGICIVNEEFVNPNKTIYILERQKVLSFKNKFTVKDENKNNDLYVCELQQRGQNCIKNMKGGNVVRFDCTFGRHFEMVLYSGNSNTGKNINIKHHISLGNSRYSFELYNKASGRNEVFEVYRTSFTNIKIYHGKKSEGGTLICYAEKTKNIPLHYKATIESNVDSVFALTFVFYFIKLFQRRAAIAAASS